MLNLTEKHVVVVLVLIAIIFLLFLSTRTPICNKETFNGLNHYSQENNDLYMSDKKLSDITDIIESNKENPLLLTKSDMADLKGSYDLNNNSSVVDIFTNSYEADINNKIPAIMSERFHTLNVTRYLKSCLQYSRLLGVEK